LASQRKIHIDAWREITSVDNYAIEIISKDEKISQLRNLFFINLGGYKKGEFEEYHYKMITVAKTLGIATRKVKTTTFSSIVVLKELEHPILI
jgi:hypothetical protein